MKGKTTLKLVFPLIAAALLGACGDDDASGGDTTRPTMSGAIAKSNTSVVVNYSEPMGPSAADASNYSIAQENVSSEAGGLPVLSAALSADKASVTLTTASQAALTYRVTAVGVRDQAGNVIAQRESGAGSTIDPASAVFAGIAPSLVELTVESGLTGWIDTNNNDVVDAGDGLSDAQGNTFLLQDANGDGVVDNWTDVDGDGLISGGDVVSGLLDSDLDGLQDSTENQGWTVTVTKPDGSTTQKEVTSDPFKADTDGDGVDDFEELTNGADPRSADTDNDGISDYDEWNVVFSDMTHQDSDGDGLPDLDEYKFLFTSPILADTDGDGISDADELDNNRNPRIADRPKFSIDVKTVNLTLHEDYSYTDETGVEQSVENSSSVSLAQDTSVSFTSTDSGVTESTGYVEAEVEAGIDYTQVDFPIGYLPGKTIVTAGGGGSWSDSRGWQTDKSSAQSASETYENSLTKGETLTSTTSYTRNITGATIALSVDVLNQGDFTLTFSDIQISVLKREGKDLLPIATLSLPDAFGDLQISPLNQDGKGQGIIFENTAVPANVVEDLMKNVPGLVFKVVNYTVTDNDGISFASSDQDVFNKTAGIVFDFGDNGDAERALVSVAGSRDVDGYVGGGWQGGIDGEGHPRGISLDYAMQDILGMTRHYRYDTVEAGLDGTLDTPLDESSDDVLDGDRILPGPDGWINSQPVGDDVLKTSIVDHRGNPTLAEQGIIAGPDRRANSVALGDDVQEVPVNTEGVPYGTVVVSAGPNKVLDSVAGDGDLVEYVGGYETSRSCVGNDSTVGLVCTLNSDCDTALESNGSCTGPERIARINTLRSGDFNRDWFIFRSESLPTPADYNKIVINRGQIFRLAFLQDLDRDGLTARTEQLNGSIDSSANRLDNRKFGKDFNFKAELAAGPGTDVFPDSRDSDYDGLSDYAEIKVGWTINNPDGSLTRVYPHPGLADSDGDGLLDIEEMDLRGFCATDGSEWRTDALCAFLNDDPVSQADAVAIIAGKNGKAESTLAGDDEAVPGKEQGTSGLLYGTATILPGDNNVIDTKLAGDDRYAGRSDNVPASHPRLADTDNDGITDYKELTGFSTGDVMVDSGDGVAEAVAAGDDIALVQPGTEMRPYGVLITAGPDGVLNSVPVAGTEARTIGSGDDGVTLDGFIGCGFNGKLETIPVGTDQAVVAFGAPCPQNIFDPKNHNVGIKPASGYSLQTEPNLTSIDVTGGDQVRAGVTVRTDPLRADSDADGVVDGLESLQGTNPTIADSPDFRDTDNDGLTDYVEEKGWTITVNGKQYLVTSDPTNPDSDGDGLPDLVEKDIGSSPVALSGLGDGTDSDGDGLTDYQEFNDFAKYANHGALFSGFELIDDGSTHYGTSPIKADTDGDGLNDYAEAITHGTSPTKRDTDGDSLSDNDEVNGTWTVQLSSGSYTVSSDPLAKDADNDGLNDWQEKQAGTDPEKANTDDDDYGVNDAMELALGTSPLIKGDRCVKVSLDSVTLNNGVDGTDDGGDVWNDVTVNHVNQSLVDYDTSANDLAGSINSWMSVGQTKALSVQPSQSTMMLLAPSDKISFVSKANYRDFGIAAWSPIYTATKTFPEEGTVPTAGVAAETVIDLVYQSGNIKITTKAAVTVLLNSVNGTCK